MAFLLNIKKVLPQQILNLLTPIYREFKRVRFRVFGRPVTQGETSKANSRRQREGFFKYCQGRGLDIGFGGDLLASNCTGYDFEHGDAQNIVKFSGESFDFVYSSHVLEHMEDPAAALSNWWGLVKKGGYLLLYIPHRDLYEKKIKLPSRWNLDHKHFFIVRGNEPPDTIGVHELIQDSLPGSEIIYIKECSEGHTISDPNLHSDGEYSIEAVIRKI